MFEVLSEKIIIGSGLFLPDDAHRLMVKIKDWLFQEERRLQTEELLSFQQAEWAKWCSRQRWSSDCDPSKITTKLEQVYDELLLLDAPMLFPLREVIPKVLPFIQKGQNEWEEIQKTQKELHEIDQSQSTLLNDFLWIQSELPLKQHILEELVRLYLDTFGAAMDEDFYDLLSGQTAQLAFDMIW